MRCNTTGHVLLSSVTHTSHGGHRDGCVVTACTTYRDAIPVPEEEDRLQEEGDRLQEEGLGKRVTPIPLPLEPMTSVGYGAFRAHGGPLTPGHDAGKVLRGRRRALRLGPC